MQSSNKKINQSCVSVNYPVDIVENSLKLPTMARVSKTKLYFRNENLFQLHIGTFGLMLLPLKIMFSFNFSILSSMEQGNMEASFLLAQKCHVGADFEVPVIPYLLL